VDAERIYLLGVLGLAVATIAAGLAAVTGGPYLTADAVNPFSVLYLVALFGALFAVPFWIEASLRDSQPDRDVRWERALVVWGIAAAAVIGLGVMLWAGFGIDGASYGGSLAIATLVDGVVVVGTLVAWMLSG
jgi:hypothetical protein